MRPVVAIAAAFLVAACTSFGGSREAQRYFVLDAAPASAAVPAAGAARVTVAATTASAFYDTQDIAYSRAPGTRGYYQFSRWTERPQRAVHAQLAARLDARAARGGPVLTTHLDEIYHDAAQPPGTARLAITAELVDPVSRAVLARRSFTAAAPAASYDAAGAVGGMRRALGALLDEIVAWVDAQAPAQAGRGPPRR
jgi:cholesterol transport system auxiliary component